MLIDHFPPLGLRLRTPRLELRLPAPEELASLAELAAGGIHPPEDMPFVTPWTRLPAPELARTVIQGQGIGTEMRAAVLHLAFAGLDAAEAVSAAFEHNGASLAVSGKLGYQPDGIERRVVCDELTIDRRSRLTRAAWERHRTIPVAIEGLAACLPLFGVAGGGQAG